METQLWIIAICQIVTLLAVVVIAAAVVWLIVWLKKFVSSKVDEAMSEVKPIIEQARGIAEQAKSTADTVAERVDSIMSTAEDTVGSVGDTVKSVSGKMEAAVDPRVVNLAGIVGTAAKCVQIARDVKTIKTETPPAEEPCGSDG